MVLVEKLCRVCAPRSVPSHTFRLPQSAQSATIPRCLMEVSSRGRQFHKGRAPGARGKQDAPVRP